MAQPEEKKFTSDHPLVLEGEKRLKRATSDKNLHAKRLDDYYRLVMPWRHQINNGYSDDYVDEIFDNTALDSVADFSSDMLAIFTPEHHMWIEPVPNGTLSLADKETLRPQIIAYNEAVFAEIRRSNYFAEALECYKDLTHGTMAMIIQDYDKSGPMHCESIPITNLLIARGPKKNIDTKAYDMPIYMDQVPALWPSAKDNEDIMKMVKDSPAKEVTVRQTIWRDYTDLGNEKYKYAAYFGDHFLQGGDYTGNGSCPIIVARWDTDNTTAWGFGPGYYQLPNIKTQNLLKELILKALDYATDPASTYDDDGTINMENGIQAGTHIPRMPGSKIDILESGANFNAAYFEKDDLKMQIKRGYFQDQPEQLGKTPPTATQWLDEATKAARRMGAPAGRLTIEWLYQVYGRFAYLLAERGKLPKVELNGELVSLNPTSPLLRSMKQEMALQKHRFAGMLVETVGPELATMIINPVEYAYSIADDLGIPPGILGDKNEVKEMIRLRREMQAAGQQ